MVLYKKKIKKLKKLKKKKKRVGRWFGHPMAEKINKKKKKKKFDG